MYLIIDIDNNLYKKEKITDEDRLDCDEGLKTIVDIDTMDEYYSGAWISIELREG